MTYKGPMWVQHGLKFLYGTHMGPIWASCPDYAHMGPICQCVLGKPPNMFHNLIKFCLHVMKGTLRITLMLFDSCLSLIETVGYSKGQPTPYSNSSKYVAFAILYAKYTAFDNIRNIVFTTKPVI